VQCYDEYKNTHWYHRHVNAYLYDEGIVSVVPVFTARSRCTVPHSKLIDFNYILACNDLQNAVVSAFRNGTASE